MVMLVYNSPVLLNADFTQNVQIACPESSSAYLPIMTIFPCDWAILAKILPMSDLNTNKRRYSKPKLKKTLIFVRFIQMNAETDMSPT